MTSREIDPMCDLCEPKKNNKGSRDHEVLWFVAFVVHGSEKW